MAHLVVDYEGRDEQQDADNTQPKQAIDEVRIDAQHDTGNHRGEFGLPLPVDKIGDSKNARDKSNEEAFHVSFGCSS